MMKGFMTAPQTTEDILKSVLDDIITDVERKDKNRKRKQRQKEKKKRDKENSWFMNPKPDNKHRFCNDDGYNLPHEIAERTENELKPLGYTFVDFYDTTIYDETETQLEKFITEEYRGMEMCEVPANELERTVHKFLELTSKLPPNVILFADPLKHKLFMCMISNLAGFDIAINSIYLIWTHRGEDFHFAKRQDTPQSFYNAQIRKIKNSGMKPLQTTELIECPICCEKKIHNTESDELDCIIGCNTCGNEICGECLLQYTMKERDIEFPKLPNGKYRCIMKHREHTCPFCKGGFFYPDNPSKLGKELMISLSAYVDHLNGVKRKEKTDQQKIKECFEDIKSGR